jgi:hypothetical protein
VPIGQYVGPEHWKQLKGLVHALDRQAGAERRGSAGTHQQLDQFINEMQEKMSFVSQRLGDSASGPEYEVGRVTQCAARALRCATAEDIRNNVIECAKQAAYAIDFTSIRLARSFVSRAGRRMRMRSLVSHEHGGIASASTGALSVSP